MDNKRVLSTALLMFALAMGWFWTVTYLDRRHPEWNLMGKRPAATQPAVVQPGQALPGATANAPAVTTGGAPVAGAPAAAPADGAPVEGGPAAGAQATSPDGQSATPVATPVTTLQVSPIGTPAAHTLGSTAYKDSVYSMGVELSPRGAGIESVTLNQFRRLVGSAEPYVYQQPLPGFADQSRTLSTQAVRIDGERLSLVGVEWGLTEATPERATFSLEIRRSGKPLIRLDRVFRLVPAAQAELKAQGYELETAFSIRNLTDAPVTVAVETAGPVAPPKELDKSPDQQTVAGYFVDGLTKVEQHFTQTFSGATQARDLTLSSKGAPLAWVGTGSAYFDAILRPIPSADGQMLAGYLESVTAKANAADPNAPDRQVSVSLLTRPESIAAGATLTHATQAFFIPKQRSLLGSDYFRQPPLELHRSLVSNAGPCGICVLDVVVDALVGMLRAFHFVLRDWGLAIIALVVLVRLLLHPLTKASQLRMMKMSKMAPELERLKKKYADDKEALQKAMAKHQMEQFPTMMLGCLPMFIQMPIWIALYSALQTTFELRQAPFLRHWGINLTWIKDLAKPDRLLYFPDKAVEFYLPLCGQIHIDSINLLPILLGIVFFAQQKLTPKPPPADEQQATQQKMMQWMVIPFALLMYNLPSGLNLYILTSTTIGIIESKRIRDHLKKQDELEKAGIVVSENGGAAAAIRKSRIGTWLGGLFDKAQAMADDARKQQAKAGKKK